VSGRSKDQDLIDELARWLDAPDQEKAKTNGHTTLRSSAGSVPTDEQVIEKCRAAENSPKFEALYDRGDVHSYYNGDDSRADLGLLRILAFYTQDEMQLERVFSSSALGQRE
jgi:primase-polymerase (primpol)-like protein